jgi:hypothetical protein
MEIVVAPSYITDLALSDFHVFDPLKYNMGANHCSGD